MYFFREKRHGTLVELSLPVSTTQVESETRIVFQISEESRGFYRTEGRKETHGET